MVKVFLARQLRMPRGDAGRYVVGPADPKVLMNNATSAWADLSQQHTPVLAHVIADLSW